MYSMRSLSSSLVLVPFLVLAACGAPEEDDAMDAAEETATPAETTPAGEMATETEPAGEVAVTLETVNESGVSGSATATHQGDSVVVAVQVQGVTAGEELPAHIHQGDCATGGSVLVRLNSVPITDGSGSSTTTLATAQVPEGQAAFVQVHGTDGAPVACGDLQGHESGM